MLYGGSYRADALRWKQEETERMKAEAVQHAKDNGLPAPKPSEYLYQGKLFDETSSTGVVTIGHENPTLAGHWNAGGGMAAGRDSTQAPRLDYFSGRGDPRRFLLIQPKTVNSSEGGSAPDGTFDPEVTTRFRGPD